MSYTGQFYRSQDPHGASICLYYKQAYALEHIDNMRIYCAPIKIKYA